MRFDLRRPCAKCPFRADIPAYLTRGRVDELRRELLEQDKTFACHQTVDYAAMAEVALDDDDDEAAAYAAIPHGEEQHCAGAAILLEKYDRPNQMMRWIARIGGYDCTKLDPCAPVFDTFDEMRKAQPR